MPDPKIIFSFLLLSLFLIFGAPRLQADVLPTLHQLPAEIRVDYLSLNMPNGEPKMGLLGLHYDVNLLPLADVYSGLGLYSAVQGNQGGVFILGVDNHYRPQISGPLYFNMGLFLGAAGSANNQPFGGGFIALPYVGIGYRFQQALVDLNYSYANFTGGDIASSQVMLDFTLPLDFSYFDIEDADFSVLSIHQLQFPSGRQEEAYYISPLFQVYQQGKLGLIGFEAGRYFTSHFYGALRTLGVAHGNANGYMNVMAGLGYDLPLFQSAWSWTNDFMIGSGGGGGTAVGNGLMAEVDTGLAWSINSHFTPKVMLGYLSSSNQHFKTWVGSLGFNYHFDLLASAGEESEELNDGLYAIRPWRISVGSQTLIQPDRSSGKGNLDFLTLDINQFLTPSYYISYRTAFPYSGDNPQGGNSVEGLIGVGAEIFPGSRLQPSFTLLVGAIGGGGIQAGGGLIIEPELGLHLAMESGLGLSAAIGQMKSVQGHFNSTVLTGEVSLSFGEAEKI